MASSENQRPKRIRPGDASALRRKVWHAILTAETLLDHHDPEIKLRAVNALGQVGNVYKGILADHDLEQRIAALEKRVEESNP